MKYYTSFSRFFFFFALRLCVHTQIASFQCVSGLAKGLYHCERLHPSAVTNAEWPIQESDKAFFKSSTESPCLL